MSYYEILKLDLKYHLDTAVDVNQWCNNEESLQGKLK